MAMISVGADQVRALVPMPAAIEAVREAFVGLAGGEFEMPVRTVLGDGEFLDMAVHHRPSGTAAFKTLSVNLTGRDPAIVGTVVWSDLASTDQLVAEAGTLTTIRTGAVTGVATDLLAPADASTCVVFGTGAQAPDQVRAVLAVRPIQRVTLVGRDHARAARMAEILAGELGGVHLEVTSDGDSAVGTADVICCATPALEPLFRFEALPDRVHVNAIGSFRPTMRELPDELLAAGLVVVDDREAVLEEAGEIRHAVAAGLLEPDRMVELGSALTTGVRPTSLTTFKSVGVAVQDWAVARLLADAVLR